jgi:hypothetical protein
MPEVTDGAVPFNFHRLLEWPVFQTKCLPCHQKRNKGLTDMSYRSVATYRLAFGFQGEEGFNWKGTGGSRTTPGRFGAYASGIWNALTTKPAMKGIVDSLSKEELRRLTLWLEMNSNRLCWETDDPVPLEAQRRGDVVWPAIDVVPHNPTGVEYLGTDDKAPGQVPNVQKLEKKSPVSHVLLRWQPAVDNESGVGAYKIFRNDTFLCMVPDLKYVDRAAKSNISNAYEVSAVDRRGNEGPKTVGYATLVEDETAPIAIAAISDNPAFAVATITRNKSLMVTVRVPGGTNGPATISLFALNGRRIGCLRSERGEKGAYTAQFRQTGFTGVRLCAVRVGNYEKTIRIGNGKR